MSIVNKKGIDISEHNGDINLSIVKKAGFKFVMIKCGSGSDFKTQDDPFFEDNVKKAEKLGLPWGVYIYSYATNITEAKSEVEHVKRLLKGKKPTLPIAFDMEDADGYKSARGALNKSLITDICKTFLEGIKKAGYYPMLYTSFSWIGYYISTEITDKYDLWIAQWSTNCSYTKKNLGIWQYGGETNYIDTPYISGIGHMLDKNKCFKNYQSIIKKGGYNNWEKTPLKELDKTGYKRGNNSIGVLAVKQLLILADKQGVVKANIKNDKGFGKGTEDAVNRVLKKLGYKQNGIAGENFIKKITKLLK